MAGNMQQASLRPVKALSAAEESFLGRAGDRCGVAFPSRRRQAGQKAKRNREIQVAKGSAIQAPGFRSRISSKDPARPSRPCPSKEDDGLGRWSTARGVGLGAAPGCRRAATFRPIDDPGKSTG
ncbi:hypothetical protein B0T16DRAFT_418561 [Cercophora newfieldiana]|uniref:Uncharacterized protein n=1 Tax=Cercophora newfieldiana TaxID=92897 RepID=A0AA40CJM2_9PEZI|nr:hypothetical protein B0T16DRAFT_418561 [Cercophora newfieldiana]